MVGSKSTLPAQGGEILPGSVDFEPFWDLPYSTVDASGTSAWLAPNAPRSPWGAAWFGAAQWRSSLEQYVQQYSEYQPARTILQMGCQSWSLSYE